jgi:hypothetical protein
MEKKDDLSPVEVFAGTQWEAAFMKSLLEDNEIQAFLKDEIWGMMAPWNVTPGGFGAVKVVVPTQDEERAKQVVADYYKNKNKEIEETES